LTRDGVFSCGTFGAPKVRAMKLSKSSKNPPRHYAGEFSISISRQSRFCIALRTMLSRMASHTFKLRDRRGSTPSANSRRVSTIQALVRVSSRSRKEMKYA